MIRVIGIGVGNLLHLTLESLINILSADCVIGTQRQIDAVIGQIRNFDLFLTDNVPNTDKILEKKCGGVSFLQYSGSLNELLSLLQQNKGRKISVLASGEPSFFGIGDFLIRKLGVEKVAMSSGVSSVSTLASKVGINLNDIYLTSMHGRSLGDGSIKFESIPKIAFLTDKKNTVRAVANYFEGIGQTRTLYVGANLSYEGERVCKILTNEILNTQSIDPNPIWDEDFAVVIAVLGDENERF